METHASRAFSQTDVARHRDDANAVWKPALRIVESHIFGFFMNVNTLASAITPGLSMYLIDPRYDTIWTISNHCSAAGFCFETVLQILARGRSYFKHTWFIFDFTLTGLAATDIWVLPFLMPSYDSAQVLSMRVLRVVRALRVIRILRVHAQLRIVAEGIGASASALFWIGLLMFSVVYVSGLICVTFLADDVSLKDRGLDPAVYFGTLTRSMLTLFNLVFLTEWDMVIRAVYEEHGIIACVPFLLFVITCSCGLLNVIIAVIVERTGEAEERVREGHREEKKKRATRAVEKIVDKMFSYRCTQTDSITVSEMIKAIRNEDVQKLIIDADLPKGFTMRHLYTMLDVDADDCASKDEVADGIFRLVHSTEFQRLCMLEYNSCQLQRDVKSAHADILQELRRHQALVAQEFKSLRAEISKLGSATSQEASISHNRSNASSVVCFQPTSVDEAPAPQIPDHECEESSDIAECTPSHTIPCASKSILPSSRSQALKEIAGADKGKYDISHSLRKEAHALDGRACPWSFESAASRDIVSSPGGSGSISKPYQDRMQVQGSSGVLPAPSSTCEQALDLQPMQDRMQYESQPRLPPASATDGHPLDKDLPCPLHL